MADPPSLRRELGFPRPIADEDHEVLLGVMVTAARLQREADRILRPLGLTESQLDVLMLLAYQGGGEGLDQSAIGRMLVVNRSNVTGLVDRMERLGWVGRGPDAADRRVKRVRLTPAGRVVLGRAEKPYLARVRAVMAALPRGRRRALAADLAVLRGALAG